MGIEVCEHCNINRDVCYCTELTQDDIDNLLIELSPAVYDSQTFWKFIDSEVVR